MPRTVDDPFSGERHWYLLAITGTIGLVVGVPAVPAGNAVVGDNRVVLALAWQPHRAASRTRPPGRSGAAVPGDAGIARWSTGAADLAIDAAFSPNLKG